MTANNVFSHSFVSNKQCYKMTVLVVHVFLLNTELIYTFYWITNGEMNEMIMNQNKYWLIDWETRIQALNVTIVIHVGCFHIVCDFGSSFKQGRLHSHNRPAYISNFKGWKKEISTHAIHTTTKTLNEIYIRTYVQCIYMQLKAYAIIITFILIFTNIICINPNLKNKTQWQIAIHYLIN